MIDSCATPHVINCDVAHGFVFCKPSMRQKCVVFSACHELTTMKRSVTSEVGGCETLMALWLPEKPPGGGGCVHHRSICHICPLTNDKSRVTQFTQWSCLDGPRHIVLHARWHRAPHCLARARRRRPCRSRAAAGPPPRRGLQ